MVLRTAAGASLAYILLPMFFVIWLAFFAQEIPSFPPEGYSLKWFRAVPGNDRFVTGFLLSLQVAVVSTSAFRGTPEVASTVVVYLLIQVVVVAIVSAYFSRTAAQAAT